MATPTILINQSGLPAGSAGQSRSDLVLNQLVTMTDPANPGAATYQWEMIARPTGSSATLSGATTATCTFTPDITGTYLIKLLVNGIYLSGTVNEIGDFVSTQGGCAVVLDSAFNSFRLPAPGETLQFHSTEGWHNAEDRFIRFTTNNSRLLNPLNFGAKFDGVTDDTVAIQNCINAADTAGTGVFFPPGTAVISNTILFNSFAAFNAVGVGPRATEFSWIGPADRPAFSFVSCTNCYLGNLSVTVNAATTLYEGIRITGSAGGTAPTRTTIDRVHLLGDERLTNGIAVRLATTSSGTYDDRKNDHNRFLEVMIQAYTDNAVILEGYNTKNQQFEDCLFQGRDTGQIGINTATIPGYGGGFTWNRGMNGENQVADFYIGQRNDPISINDHYSQTSARWIVVLDQSFDGVQPAEVLPITVRNSSWRTQNEMFPDDNEIIQIYSPGPITIDTCQIGARGAFGTPKIRIEPRNAARTRFLGGLRFVNNIVNAANVNGFFTAEQPDDMTGSIHFNGETYSTMGIEPEDPYEAGHFMPRKDSDWLNYARLPLPFFWADCQDPKPISAWAPTTTYAVGDRVSNDTPQKIYLCTDPGTSAGSGGPTGTGSSVVDGGVIWQYLSIVEISSMDGLLQDRQRHRKNWHLTPYASPLYRQSRAPWTGYSVGWNQGSGQEFSLEDDDNLLNTTSSGLVLGGYFEFPSLPAVNGQFIVLGGGASGAGQGPFLRLRTDGTLQIIVNGTGVTGGYNYVDGNPHLVLFMIDHRNQKIRTLTDKEIIDATYTTSVQSISRKGYGATSSINAFSGYARLLFGWKGPEAEYITTLVSGVVTSLRWP